RISATIRTARSRSSGGYLLDEPPDMTPSFPRTGVSGHAGAVQHNVGAFNWGLVAGKTQTYLPWDSWDHPYRAPPKVWFHDLLHPNGRPYRDGEVQTIRKLNGMPSQD
ncbi:hypothetical protein ACNJLC_20115, partial [Mycobacterium tuberculosis]